MRSCSKWLLVVLRRLLLGEERPKILLLSTFCLQILLKSTHRKQKHTYITNIPKEKQKYPPIYMFVFVFSYPYLSIILLCAESQMHSPETVIVCCTEVYVYEY